MKILMSGANGLIGGEVKRRLQARGDDVIALSRSAHDSASRQGAIAWPENGALNPQELENFDAVIHLAGESVGGRWTKAKKQAIYNSRVGRTRQLCEALRQTSAPPKAFLCASAIGIYGDRGGEELSEDSAPGTGFLADVCRDWENACAVLRDKSPVSHLRFGIVLDKNGGALKQMLLPFRLGLGGPLGDGLQFWSWIALSDAARAILHVLDNELSGAFNVTAPSPVRNREFSQELAAVLHRPAVFPVPTLALRFLMNDFADEGLLSSARVLPRGLLESDFQFEFETLPKALAAILKE